MAFAARPKASGGGAEAEITAILPVTAVAIGPPGAAIGLPKAAIGLPKAAVVHRVSALGEDPAETDQAPDELLVRRPDRHERRRRSRDAGPGRGREDEADRRPEAGGWGPGADRHCRKVASKKPLPPSWLARARVIADALSEAWRACVAAVLWAIAVALWGFGA